MDCSRSNRYGLDCVVGQNSSDTRQYLSRQATPRLSAGEASVPLGLAPPEQPLDLRLIHNMPLSPSAMRNQQNPRRTNRSFDEEDDSALAPRPPTHLSPDSSPGKASHKPWDPYQQVISNASNTPLQIPVRGANRRAPPVMRTQREAGSEDSHRRASSPTADGTEESSPQGSPRLSPNSLERRKKSRPWRVDVLLKKGGGGRGVERSTTSWKQQMKERKEIFAYGGVTVHEGDFDEGEPSPYPELDADGNLRANLSRDSTNLESIEVGLEDDAVSLGGVSGIESAPPVPTQSTLNILRPSLSMPAQPQPTEAQEEYNDEVATSAYIKELRGEAKPFDEPGDDMQEPESSADKKPMVTGMVMGEVLWPFPEKEDETNSDSKSSPAPATPLSSATTSRSPMGISGEGEVESIQKDLSPSSAALESLRAMQKKVEEHYEKSFGEQTMQESPNRTMGPSHPVDTAVENVEVVAQLEKSAPESSSEGNANMKLVMDDLKTSIEPMLRDEQSHAVVSFGRAGLDPQPPKPQAPSSHLKRNQLNAELEVAVSELYVGHHHTIESVSTGEGKRPSPTHENLFNMTQMQLESARRAAAKSTEEAPKSYLPEQTAQHDLTPVDPVTAISEGGITPAEDLHKPSAKLPTEPAQVEVAVVSNAMLKAPEPTPSDAMLPANSPTTVSTSEVSDAPRNEEGGKVSTDKQDVARSMEPDVNDLPNEEDEKKDDEDMLSMDIPVIDRVQSPSTPVTISVNSETLPEPLHASSEDAEESRDAVKGSPTTDEAPKMTEVVDDKIDQAEDLTRDLSEPAPEAPVQEPKTPRLEEKAEEEPKSGGKKGKASKWKKRLAKKKGVQIADEPKADEVQNTTIEPSEFSKDSEVEPSTSEQVEPEDEPSPTAKKGKSSKAKKWMKRLASKRTVKSAQQEVSSTDEAPATSQEESLPSSIQDGQEEQPTHTEELVVEEPLTSIAPDDNARPSSIDSNVEASPSEENQVESKSATPGTTNVHDVQANSEKSSPKFDKDLKNSFMAFDALLQQRAGLPVADDEYSEYTIEESLAQSKSNAFSDKTKTEYHFEDGQSYMEYTIEESIHDAAPGPDPNAESGAFGSGLMQSRMFTAPKVMTEPTISVPQLDDDEMTQLTFDHSMTEPVVPEEATEVAPSAPVKMLTKPVPLPAASKSGTSAETTTKSRKRDSLNGSSHHSHSSRGASSAGSSEESSKRISEILRKEIWSPDEAIVQKALETLNLEATKGSAFRAKITQFGGVVGIIRAMENYAPSENVQLASCTLLTTMARDPDTQIAIGEMGGITVIVNALTTHTEHEKIQEKGCYAIANISRHRGTTDNATGAVPALVAAMTRHSKNIVVQAKAFSAIANLCMDNKERLKELSDCGGMLAMTQALQKPWPSKMGKHEAISNLSILLRCLAEDEERDQDQDDDLSIYSEQPSVIHERRGSVDLSVISGMEESAAADGEYYGNFQYDDEYGNEAVMVSDFHDGAHGPASKRDSLPLGLEPPTTLGLEPPTTLGGDYKTEGAASSKSSNPTDPTAVEEMDDENCTIS